MKTLTVETGAQFSNDTTARPLGSLVTYKKHISKSTHASGAKRDHETKTNRINKIFSITPHWQRSHSCLLLHLSTFLRNSCSWLRRRNLLQWFTQGSHVGAPPALRQGEKRVETSLVETINLNESLEEPFTAHKCS